LSSSRGRASTPARPPGVRIDHDEQGRPVGLDIDHASTMLDPATLDTVGLPLQAPAGARRRTVR
jgi:hypothetical protein